MAGYDKYDADPKRLPKLKAKYKKKWLKALRSGKYEQGEGVLLYHGKYCCLGVLCDVVKDEMKEDFDFYDEALPPEEVWELVLTKDSLKKLGDQAKVLWSDEYANRKSPVSVLPLTMRNDGNGVFGGRQQSFKKIANIIEKHM